MTKKNSQQKYPKLSTLDKTAREEKNRQCEYDILNWWCTLILNWFCTPLSLSHPRKGCYTTKKVKRRRVTRQDSCVERDCIERVSSVLTNMSEVNYDRCLRYLEQLGEHKNKEWHCFSWYKPKSHHKKLAGGRVKAKENPFFKQHNVQVEYSFQWKIAEDRNLRGLKKQLNESICIVLVQKFIQFKNFWVIPLGEYTPICACGSTILRFFGYQ